MFGGTNINTMIGRVNDRSIFHLLTISEYGMSMDSIAHIYWPGDFSPFTLSHSRFINTAIDSLIKSNTLITRINVYLVPHFRSKCLTIKWSDKLALIKLAVKQLQKDYKTKETEISVNFYASDFSQTINSTIYLYENFSPKPDIYLELELFCKLNTINPSQVYYVVQSDDIISIFSGIDQTNTIHLISKYNFITWNKTIPYNDLEVVAKYIGKEIDEQNIKKLNVTQEILELLFKKNIENFKSKQTLYTDLSLVKYDDKRLDFFYDAEIKLNGELDYKTMEWTIKDIDPLKIGKVVICLFAENLELDSSMVRNGIQFINKNIFSSLINYIADKGLYF
jgi:nicotinic acid mononucleotide adenylyltransferase